MEILQVTDKDLWSANFDEFDHSLFNTSEFLEAVSLQQGEPVFFDFKNDHKIVAKIAGIKLTGKHKFQNRLSFYCGPAVHKEAERAIIKQCYRLLVHYARKNGYYRIIKLSYDYHLLPGKIKHFRLSKRAEYMIDLKQDSEVIEKNFAHNVIYIKRKALNQGYQFVESTSEEMVIQLIAMLDETRKTRMSKGCSYYDYYYIPSFDRSSLECLVKREMIHFYSVVKDNQTLSIMAVMIKHKRAYGLFMGCTPEGYKAGAPTFLNYKLIHSLKEKNFEYLNLGGVPLGKSHQGLVEFKKRLGAQKVWSLYGSTNFLIFPFNLLNPSLNLFRLIPENKLLLFIKKKMKVRNF